MTRDSAETLALTCLAWLVTEEDLLPVFLGATGASEGDLRSQAGDPDFLAAVLDFLMLDDAWVMRFCTARAVAPEAPAQARMALPGGAQVNWT